MAIQTKLVEYQDGDVLLEGFMAWDDSISGARPAVAIAHAWSGRSEFECEKAKKLAEMGYVGFALDAFGKGVRGNSVEENSALITPFLEDRPMLQQRVTAGINTAKAQVKVDESKVAAIGYCFGGLTVLDLARIGGEVKGVVSLHGLFVPPDNTEGTRITAKVLCLHGYDDPMVPHESILDLSDELTQAGADWQIHAYGNTKHAFTNPEANDHNLGTVYCEVADRRSWIALQNFLSEVFA